MDSNPICHPSPAKKMKCSFLDYVELLIVGLAGQWTQTPSTTCLQPKNEMIIFGLHLTSDDQPGWSMDSNPIHDLSPAKEWNAHFWITLNFWWSARLVDGLKPHLPPLSTHKMKCSFLHYIQLVMIGQAGQWTRTPSAIPLQTKKWYVHFCITFKFWSLAGLVNGLEPHLQPLSSQNNEMLIFG